MSENNISQEKDQELLNLLKGLQEMVAGSGYSISDIFKAGADALGITNKLQVQPETPTVAAPVVEQAEPAVSYQETQPVTQEPIDDAEIQMSEEELKDFLADKFTEITNHSNVVSSYYGNFQLSSGIERAKAGVVRPGELEELIELEALDEESKREYLTSTYEISLLSRERAYAYYKFASPEEMEKTRTTIIDVYKKVKELGEKSYGTYESRILWPNGTTSISVDTLTAMRDGRYSGLGAGRGINATENGIVYDKTGCYYDPINFDTKFDVLCSILTQNEGKVPCKDMFQRCQTEVNRLIGLLEAMSVDEVRQFKIDQMKLEPEEIARINKDIREYKHGKQEKPETP